MIKAILFDKDGTLLDFSATFAPATTKVLQALSQGDKDQMARMARAVDFSIEDESIKPGSVLIAGTPFDIAVALLPDGPEREQEKLGERLDGLYVEHTQFTLAPMPKLKITLDLLIERGFVLGVATNDSEEGARLHLDRLIITDRFESIVGYDSGHGAKPDPGMVQAFAKHCGLQPNEIAMVGDSAHDCLAGSRAGSLSIGVLSGGASTEELAPYAHHILDSIADLPMFLQKANQ